MIWAILSLGLTSWQRAGGRVPAVLFEESISVTNLKYSPTLGCVAVSKKNLKLILKNVSKNTFLKVI